MSKVISFRLDNANPREALALQVLNAWSEKGFNIRHILTTALVELDQSKLDLNKSRGNHDWDAIFDQIGQLLDFVEEMKSKPAVSQDNNQDQTMLRESFLSSIKQWAKPGIKLE